MCVFTGEMISASVWLHLQNRKLNLLKLMAGAWECEKGCGERVGLDVFPHSTHTHARTHTHMHTHLCVT